MDNSSLVNTLKAFGYIVFVLGIIAGILVLTQLSKGTMFSNGEITPMAVILSIIVVFYHAVHGVLCLGLAELLDRKNTLSTSLNPVSMSSSGSVSSTNYKKCSQCNKLYEASFTGEFCDQCGAKL
jgi:hypothetical protein